MAAVFATLASSFRDFGVAEYLIQCDEVTDAVLRASLAVNLSASWLIALVLLAVSVPAAGYFGDPLIGAVMRVQALSFVLIPFGAVTLAWFRRGLHFRPILLANVAGQVVSAAGAVGLVAAGWGVMGLAWSGVLGVLATVLVALALRPVWFPRWPTWAGAGRVARFGGFASGAFVVTQLGRGAPDLVVARAAGLGDAGLFSRANGLVEAFNRLVLQAAMPVCLPYLADGARRDGRVAPSLQRATVLLTGVGWPCLALLAVLALPALRLMYGPQWDGAVRVAQWLCLAAAIELLFRLAEEALFAIGKAREASLLQTAVQGLRVAGVLGGVAWGLAGAAMGLVLAALTGALASGYLLARHAGVSPAALLRAVWPSAALAACAAGPALAVSAWWGGAAAQAAHSLALGAAATAAAACAVLPVARLLGHPVWHELVAGAAALRQRLARRRAAG